MGPARGFVFSDDPRIQSQLNLLKESEIEHFKMFIFFHSIKAADEKMRTKAYQNQ